VPQLLKYAAGVTSFLSVITALLFYFGASHAYWFFNYFGVNSTVLQLPPEEFLMRSVDGLFVPLVALAAVGLLVVWAHRIAEPLLADADWVHSDRAVRVRAAVAAVLGAALVMIGLLNVYGLEVLRVHLTVPPLCLIAGVLLLTYASRLHQRLRAARGRPGRGALEWSGVFVLVSLGLFWAVHDYSAAAGVGRARAAAAGLPGYPAVVVYSEQDLNLHGPGVHETRCAGDESAYRFRYDGLKLVLHSGEVFLLLPARWTRSAGRAYVIPRRDTLRFEFTVAGVDADTRPC